MKKEKKIIPVVIEEQIFIIRGKKVMLDSDLARLYQVPTMRLNEQVKRNLKRFPADFMFQLTSNEYANLISQFAISSGGYGGRRKFPYAFTEHGVAMLSTVLRSERAVEMSIFIVRAFVKLRELLLTNADLAKKINDLEQTQRKQGQRIDSVYEVVKQLMNPPKPKIGFRTD